MTLCFIPNLYTASCDSALCPVLVHRPDGCLFLLNKHLYISHICFDNKRGVKLNETSFTGGSWYIGAFPWAEKL